MPSSQSSSENYMLIVSGDEQFVPFLAGWQEFKDNIRQIVEHQPGWTVTGPGPHKGQMQGRAKFDRKKDAEAAYASYYNSGGVLVHLFRTSRTNGDYRLMKCNCLYYFPGARTHSPGHSGIDAVNVNETTENRIPVMQYMNPPPTSYNYSAYPQHAAYMTTPTYPVLPQQISYSTQHVPVYSTNSGGMPVNISDGAIFTESRSVFLTRLNYQATKDDIERLLRQVAAPLSIDLRHDTWSGQPKGQAIAHFRSKEEAKAVVSRLHGTKHMGKTITVRYDADKTPVSGPPLIVDGSKGVSHGA